MIMYLNKNDRNCDRFCNDENFFCSIDFFKVVTNGKALKPFKTYKESRFEISLEIMWPSLIQS